MERLKEKVDILTSYVRHEMQPMSGLKEFNPAKFRKLMTIKELDEFEESLKDTSFKESLICHVMNKFKNTSVTNRKFVYDIIDTFTDRTLFRNFSLIGKSRNGEKNLALRDRVIYVNFIFECILKLSPIFDYDWLLEILGILCRNKYTSSKVGVKKIKLSL